MHVRTKCRVHQRRARSHEHFRFELCQTREVVPSHALMCCYMCVCLCNRNTAIKCAGTTSTSRSDQCSKSTQISVCNSVSARRRKSVHIRLDSRGASSRTSLIQTIVLSPARRPSPNAPILPHHPPVVGRGHARVRFSTGRRSWHGADFAQMQGPHPRAVPG